MELAKVDSSNQLRMMVYASLFAALTAVGAFLAIPIGPVPIVLQNMFVYLAGLLLGGRWGLASVGVYLLAGACGLPVFAGGLGGISRFIGPTGGYLIGYLPAVFLIGTMSQKANPRVVSDVLESNGSSSMATVCGASLALMDGGVPIKRPVSGIAMGLIKEGENVIILSDILGDEDHLGDMDFKVVGTSEGITSLQMDIKIKGVNREIMTAALQQAKGGRMHILGRMAEALAEPRKEVASHAPKFFTMHINPEKIKDIIGPGGKMIKGLTAEFGAKIEVDDSGTIKIFSPSGDIAQKLMERIEDITQEAKVGKIYKGVVKTIKDFGAFVEILPGTDGLVHISELADKRVNKVTDILKEGDEVTVKVLEIDSRGKIRLSRKAVLAEENK
jgi:polyribonucleotide nucleotidyltransferase